MKYNIGDKVRVKKNLKDDKQYGDNCFVSSMRCFCGKVYKIQEVRRELNSYQLENCGVWNFTDKMLEPVYTLQECIDNEYAINCDTEDKANKLMKALDSEGHEWLGNERYSKENNKWIKYGKATCYSPWEGMYADVYCYKLHGIKIVYFDDVILPQDKKKNRVGGWCQLSKCSFNGTKLCRNCAYFMEHPPKMPILDDVEKAYLEAVIRPFKDKVVCIAKISNQLRNSFYIEIKIDKDEPMRFPIFHTKMYVGMNDKPYTLKELGLFEDNKSDEK